MNLFMPSQSCTKSEHADWHWYPFIFLPLSSFNMRRVLLYLFVFLAVQGVAYYGITFAWHLTVYGQSFGDALNSLTASTPLTPALQFTITTTYTLLLLYIYIGKGWCPRFTLRHAHPPTAIYINTIVAALAAILPSLALQEALAFLPDIAKEETKGLLSSPWGFIIVCLMAPVLEEVVFRGAILNALRKWLTSDTAAILLSSLLFALLHFNPAQMPHAFLIGILLAWLCLRTGSILPAIVFHWVNNITAFTIAQIAPEWQDKTLTELFHSSTPLIIAVVLLSTICLIIALVQIQRHTAQGKQTT